MELVPLPYKPELQQMLPIRVGACYNALSDYWFYPERANILSLPDQ